MSGQEAPVADARMLLRGQRLPSPVRGPRHDERTTIGAMLDAARASLLRLTPLAAYFAQIAGGSRIVDVRTREQIAVGGRIPGAREISLNVLEWRLDPAAPLRAIDPPGLDDHVIVICQEGYCSTLAAARLQALGFQRATDVVGGFEGWLAAGLPVVGLEENSSETAGELQR